MPDALDLLKTRRTVGAIMLGDPGPSDEQIRELITVAARVPDHGKLDHFERIGVTGCVFRIPSAPRDHVLPLLDEQAALVAARR